MSSAKEMREAIKRFLEEWDATDSPEAIHEAVEQLRKAVE